MRVGLITPGFSASEHDWCIPALRDLVVALSARVEMSVFALRYPHADTSYRVFGVPVRSFGGAEARGWRRAGFVVRAVTSIRAMLRSGQLDCVHALWSHEPGLVATLACTRMPHGAVVSILGGELVSMPGIDYGGQLSRFNRWANAWSLRQAAAVTVGSESLRQLGASRGWAVDRWHRVPLGVDTRRFRPHAAAIDQPPLEGDPCLLQVGSLVPVKGHALLIDAFATVVSERPGARLHIVGEGPLRRRLEDRVAGLQMGQAVRFHGAVAHERLPALYGQADVTVVPSLFESQSVVAIEAAACGCAVFGTAVGVLSELDGATVCKSHAADTLASELLAVLIDPSELRARGERGRQWVLRHAHVGTTAEALVRLYGQVTARG